MCKKLAKHVKYDRHLKNVEIRDECILMAALAVGNTVRLPVIFELFKCLSFHLCLAYSSGTWLSY